MKASHRVIAFLLFAMRFVWADATDLVGGGISDALLLWSAWIPVPEDLALGSVPVVESLESVIHVGHTNKVCRTRLFLVAVRQTSEKRFRLFAAMFTSLLLMLDSLSCLGPTR